MVACHMTFSRFNSSAIDWHPIFTIELIALAVASSANDGASSKLSDRFAAWTFSKISLFQGTESASVPE